MTDQATVEDDLKSHYGVAGLLARIDAALVDAGADPVAPTLDHLKPVDEFHIGGIEATEAFFGPLAIAEGTRVLDLGCGIGGTARFLAHRYGAQVTGVDLTPEFVEVAMTLSARTGLAERTAFRAGSILDLPFGDGAFDLATMMHVGMNIADKGALFREVARVLVPGGRFALFDIMRDDESVEIVYPAPFAPDAAHAFVGRPEAYRDAGARAGLDLIHERDRGDYAREFFARILAATERTGPPPVGLHLLMGDAARERYGNAIRHADMRATAPWEMVFRKPG